MKESLFSILAPHLAGAAVLDLFAGSGALGLEALSRGAGRAVLVERDGRALESIAANVARTGLGPCEVRRGDVFRLWDDLVTLGPFDLVLADPPYGRGIGGRLIETAPWVQLLQPGAILSLEHEGEDFPVSACLERIDERRYGRAALTFYRRREN